jgi:hypothetical protein
MRPELMWDVCPAASHTRVGCRSALGCLMCERGALEVMIGDMNDVDLGVLYWRVYYTSFLSKCIRIQ